MDKATIDVDLAAMGIVLPSTNNTDSNTESPVSSSTTTTLSTLTSIETASDVEDTASSLPAKLYPADPQDKTLRAKLIIRDILPNYYQEPVSEWDKSIGVDKRRVHFPPVEEAGEYVCKWTSDARGSGKRDQGKVPPAKKRRKTAAKIAERKRAATRKPQPDVCAKVFDRREALYEHVKDMHLPGSFPRCRWLLDAGGACDFKQWESADLPFAAVDEVEVVYLRSHVGDHVFGETGGDDGMEFGRDFV